VASLSRNPDAPAFIAHEQNVGIVVACHIQRGDTGLGPGDDIAFMGTFP
jgi:hypothetical protein